MKFSKYIAIALASSAFAIAASAQDANSSVSSHSSPIAKVTMTTTETPTGPSYNVVVEPVLASNLDALKEAFIAMIAANPDLDHEFVAYYNAIEAAITDGASPAGPLNVALATGKDENGNPTMSIQTTVAGQKVDVSGSTVIDEHGYYQTTGNISVTNLYTDAVATSPFELATNPLKTLLVGELGGMKIDVAVRMVDWYRKYPDADPVLEPVPDPTIDGSPTI